MKLLIVSDLHFEFCPDGGAKMIDRLAKTKADVLVVAGDLGTVWLRDALDKLCKRFEHVVYTPGNHEYYASSWDGVKNVLRLAAEAHDNLHVLMNKAVTINAVRFVGTTLWFPYKEPSQTDYMLADFSYITGIKTWVDAENRRAIEFLAKNVRHKSVVVTHHAPSRRSIAERFRGDALNRFFACPLDGIIEGKKPRLWVHGHVHGSFDYGLGETRVLCNPYGYCNVDENPHFNPGLVVGV